MFIENRAGSFSFVWEDPSLSLRFSYSKWGRAALRFIAKKEEAGDPRYRLPLSQLDSPSERGASEGGSIELVWEFSNDSCNDF